MPTRFRKSFGGKGFRINLNKRGISLSTGIPGFRATTGRRGTYLTTSIPGSGISHTQKIGGSQKKNALENPKNNNYRASLPKDAAVPTIHEEMQRKNYNTLVVILGIGILFTFSVAFIALVMKSFVWASIWLVIGLGLCALIYWAYQKEKALSEKVSEIRKIESDRHAAALQAEELARQAEMQRRDHLVLLLDQTNVETLARAYADYFVTKGVVIQSIEVLGNEVAQVTVVDPDDGEKVVAIIVHTFEPVGVKFVRLAHGAAMQEKCQKSMLITNASFTNQAIKEGDEINVSMAARSDVISFLLKGTIKLSEPAK